MKLRYWPRRKLAGAHSATRCLSLLWLTVSGNVWLFWIFFCSASSKFPILKVNLFCTKIKKEVGYYISIFYCCSKQAVSLLYLTCIFVHFLFFTLCDCLSSLACPVFEKICFQFLQFRNHSWLALYLCKTFILFQVAFSFLGLFRLTAKFLE